MKKPKISTDSITSIETSTSVANNPDGSSLTVPSGSATVCSLLRLDARWTVLSLCVSMICFYLTSQEID